LGLKFASLIRFDLLLSRLFNGWLQAIQTIQKLWAVVNLHEGARFLVTRRLNQDTLEYFFSIIRSRGGFRDNPTQYEFLHAFKQASTTYCCQHVQVIVPSTLPINLCLFYWLPLHAVAIRHCQLGLMSLTAVHVWQLTDPTASAMWRTVWRCWRATVSCTLQGTIQKRLHACLDCSTCHNVVTVTRPQKIHQHPCFCPSRRIQSNAPA